MTDNADNIVTEADRERASKILQVINGLRWENAHVLTTQHVACHRLEATREKDAEIERLRDELSTIATAKRLGPSTDIISWQRLAEACQNIARRILSNLTTFQAITPPIGSRIKTMDNKKLIEELASAIRDFDDPGAELAKGFAQATIPVIERLLADAREAGARAMKEALYSNLRSDPHTGAILFPPIDPAQFREVKS